MAKRAASTHSPDDASSLALNDHLSDAAQQQLAALRRALESRLAALEEVLADPSRGESLAGLILDLSRIATEEAQAAASQACMAIRAEADKEIATLRASAKAALDEAQASLKSAQTSLEQEQAIGADLRREVDQAKLENHKQADLLAAREQLEASLRTDRERLETEGVRQQSIAADLQRAAGDLQRAAADAQQQLEKERRSSAVWQSRLEAERAAGAELRQSAENAVARLTGVERELADEQSAHEAALADLTEACAERDAIAADLARERKAAADRERAQAPLQSQLEAERAIVAELRQAAARAEELSAALGRESSKGRDADEEAALLQASLAEARQALAAAQAELETERTSMTEIRQAAENSDQQLSSARSNEAQAVADYQKIAAQLEAMAKERDRIADELTAAQKWISELREAEAEFASPSAPPHVETPPAKTTGQAPEPASALTQEEPEESWQAVRLANRYLFHSEVSVQVNGDPARLFDLSISGCQLLSPTALKPNQMVKILLPADKAPVVCSGKVVWTRLEPMAAGQPLGYRAGVRFTKADDVGIETFAARYATPS